MPWLPLPLVCPSWAHDSSNTLCQPCHFIFISSNLVHTSYSLSKNQWDSIVHIILQPGYLHTFQFTLCPKTSTSQKIQNSFLYTDIPLATSSPFLCLQVPSGLPSVEAWHLARPYNCIFLTHSSPYKQAISLLFLINSFKIGVGLGRAHPAWS